MASEITKLKEESMIKMELERGKMVEAFTHLLTLTRIDEMNEVLIRLHKATAEFIIWKNMAIRCVERDISSYWEFPV